MDLELVIGDKNLSSWSLRPWLVLAHLEVPFTETLVPLYDPGFDARLAGYSPTGKVPALRDGDLWLWESIAICEHLAERFPDRHLWPGDLRARSVARAVVAEMHAGFAPLRRDCSMDICGRHPTPALPEETREDIARVQELWRDCRARFGAGGPFLFGRHFGIADAFYAPVVTRFVSYSIDVGPVERAYMDAVLALPAMRRWLEAAQAEVAAKARA